MRPPSASQGALAGRLVLPGLLALALAGFAAVFGWGLLRADAPFWANPHGDMGMMLAGEVAGLRAPWSLPLLVTRGLLAPAPVSLVFTDSIPWLTAGLKATGLGGAVSLLGLSLLLSALAQAAAAYGLLRAWGVRRPLSLACGAVLALLLPAWLARQIGHVALSCHAFEIASLALAVRGVRRGVDALVAVGFVALGALAVGVHAYHLPPMALMLAAALASDVAQRRPGALPRAAATGAAFAVAVGLGAWVCGYDVGRGAAGGAAQLGSFEMNALAPVVPQASALAGARWADGWFTGVWDPSGSSAFEGYNYLGAGVLALGVAALVLLWRARREGEAPAAPAPAWRRWGPVWVALALLTLYAIGPRPWVGPFALGEIPLPRGRWFAAFGLFRGHGRFFWTTAYAILAGAVATVDRLAPARARAALLLGAAALQAVDMSVMLGGLHSRFARPEALLVPAALRGPAFQGRSYRLFPQFYCTRSVDVMTRVRQLALVAQRQGADTNSAQTVRPPPVNCAPPAPDLLRDAAPGDRRITVVQRGDDLPTPYSDLFTSRGDCSAYGDGVWFCGRDLQGTPGLAPVPGYDLATPRRRTVVLDMAAAPAAAAVELASGWSGPEPGFVWSQGRRAELRLPPVPPGGGRVVSLDLELAAYQPPGRAAQRVRLTVGGVSVVREVRGDVVQTVGLRLPAEAVPPGPLQVTIDTPDAVSPAATDPSSRDPRVLGVSLRRVTVGS